MKWIENSDFLYPDIGLSLTLVHFVEIFNPAKPAYLALIDRSAPLWRGRKATKPLVIWLSVVQTGGINAHTHLVFCKKKYFLKVSIFFSKLYSLKSVNETKQVNQIWRGPLVTSGSAWHAVYPMAILVQKGQLTP
jgi:hypothetical protein